QSASGGAAAQRTERRQPIVIDGRFEDWNDVASHADSAGDTHDTIHSGRDDAPAAVEHPDVDLLEFKVTHDDENLYFYFRSRGQMARAQRSENGRPAGRYYVIVAI